MDLKRVLEGLTVVAVGLVLLGNTMGWIPWEVWWSIASLWPLLLVAAGIDLIGKSLDNMWLRALGSLVVIGGLAYAVFVMAPTGPGQLGWLGQRADRVGEPFERRVPNEGASRGRASIEGGIGELVIGDGADLVSIRGESPFGKPRLDTDVFPAQDLESGGSYLAANVEVEHPGAPFTGFGRRSRLEVDLDREIVWDLELDAGLSRLDADLSGVPVRELDADLGVSSGRLRLGRPPVDPTARSVSEAKIDAGISSLTLQVPDHVKIRLSVKQGISNVDLDEGWRRVSESGGTTVWETGDDAMQQWRISLQGGISSIKVRRY